ncbi:MULTISPECIES: helix-turn-helix domain-containing protein [Burkholderia]|uniref:helix-turn-helix domain-containing protein n=1 Tax=Burkholderia TaxID=32008 RepID=UPI001C33FC43|nr:MULTISPECIES: helix-turn-helix domain-containing protein [Burkholderia]CAG2382948.1 XRE family transcriptional regulator [Burkholderia cenocepacia]CAG2382954.1 XRE family transcriptional regulator [Burkholderia cenocepacia]CAG2382965.1 XRE family transcriptional regulator [Burkholderia cenocepacia]CAG2382992.1 XRE family transcriptional regulator [Burkholderia cenocepacia]CAG2383077.1 XRE family transcriptional regulator [Burkholderia cenocepacia]
MLKTTRRFVGFCQGARMEKGKDGVRYVYRCFECRHNGEVRLPDDSHDGEAATCAQCGGPVTLEWDGGVTLEVAVRRGAPTPAELKQMRASNERTQAEMAERLGVTERQVQRWEAGQGAMPIASWQLLRRVWGYRDPADFTIAPALTRGWDTARDVARDTIERGDAVELQPKIGPRLLAIVSDTALTDNRYGARITEFPDAPGEEEFAGFCVGERVTFVRANVIHLEQRVPRS